MAQASLSDVRLILANNAYTYYYSMVLHYYITIKIQENDRKGEWHTPTSRNNGTTGTTGDDDERSKARINIPSVYNKKQTYVGGGRSG